MRDSCSDRDSSHLSRWKSRGRVRDLAFVFEHPGKPPVFVTEADSNPDKQAYTKFSPFTWLDLKTRFGSRLTVVIGDETKYSPQLMICA